MENREADGGLVPDFDTQAVFVNHWQEKGCNDEWPSYLGWQWDDLIRVRVIEGKTCDNDMALPTIDLILVEHGDATDLGWCE